MAINIPYDVDSLFCLPGSHFAPGFFYTQRPSVFKAFQNIYVQEYYASLQTYIALIQNRSDRKDRKTLETYIQHYFEIEGSDDFKESLWDTCLYICDNPIAGYLLEKLSLHGTRVKIVESLKETQCLFEHLTIHLNMAQSHEKQLVFTSLNGTERPEYTFLDMVLVHELAHIKQAVEKCPQTRPSHPFYSLNIEEEAIFIENAYEWSSREKRERIRLFAVDYDQYEKYIQERKPMVFLSLTSWGVSLVKLKIFLDFGHGINDQNEKGETLLHYLVTLHISHGDLWQQLVWILSRGGDLSIQDHSGRTPRDLLISHRGEQGRLVLNQLDHWHPHRLKGREIHNKSPAFQAAYCAPPAEEIPTHSPLNSDL